MKMSKKGWRNGELLPTPNPPPHWSPTFGIFLHRGGYAMEDSKMGDPFLSFLPYLIKNNKKDPPL